MTKHATVATRTVRRPVLVALTAAALAAGVAAAPPGAHAATLPVSSATAGFLDGTLGTLHLGDLSALAPVTASSPLNPGPNSRALSAATLNALPGLLAGGTRVFGTAGLLQFTGLVNQVAQAFPSGAAKAWVGAVSDTGSPLSNANSVTLNLTSLLSQVPAVSDAFGSFRVRLNDLIGTVSRAADGTTTSHFSVAGGTATLVSPALAALGSTVSSALAPLQSAVNGLAGGSGGLASALAALGPVQQVLSGLGLAAPTTTAGVTSNLQSAVTPLLGQTLTSADGHVRMTPQTGTITADLLGLGGPGLTNGLPLGTDLLPSGVLDTVAADVLEVVNQLIDSILSAVTSALGASPVSLTSTAGLLSGLLPTGLSIDVTGTLSQILAGTATGSSTLSLLGVPVPLPLGDVLTGLAGTITSGVGLGNQSPGSPLAVFGSALGSGVQDPVTSLIAPGLGGLGSVLSLTGNVQQALAGVQGGTGLLAGIPLLGGALGSLKLGSVSTGPAGGAPVLSSFAPTVSALTPARGPAAGGQLITLTGSNFVPRATTVRVNGTGVPASSVTVSSTSKLTFRTPAHSAGPVSVTVSTVAGTSAARSYTYLAAPTLGRLPRVCGHAAGGQQLTLTGSHFVRGATTVSLGTARVSRFSRATGSTLVLRTPRLRAGTVVVRVSTPGGRSNARTCTITR